MTSAIASGGIDGSLSAC